MTQIEAAQLISQRGARRRMVLATCTLATCAYNFEPPLWIYRPVPREAFNQAANTFDIASGLFSLALLALILVGGVIGDLRGRRRVLLVGLGGLVVANLLLPLSRAVPWFAFTRVLAGAFGALVLPVSLSLLYLAYADLPEARKRAVAVYVLLTSVALLLSGPIALLTHQALDWRAPIALPTALGTIALLMALRTTTESRAHSERRLDAIGNTAWTLVVLSVIGTFVAWRGSGLYAVLGWALALTGLLISAGLLAWWGRQTREAIFGQSLIRRRTLLILILFGFAMEFGSIGYVVQVRQVLIHVYGYGTVLSTVALMPLLLGMGSMTLYTASRLVAAEPRRQLALAILGVGVACAVTALTRAAFYPLLALLLFAFGAAMVLATITWTAAFLTAMPDDVVGVRTGINSAVFQMGAILGSLACGALLVQYGSAIYERLLTSAGVAEDRIDRALAALNTLIDPAVAATELSTDIAGRLLAGYEIAYLDAFSRVLLIVALVCALSAALAWFGLPRRGTTAPRGAIGAALTGEEQRS